MAIRYENFSVYMVPFSFHIGLGFVYTEILRIAVNFCVHCVHCVHQMNGRLVELILKFLIQLILDSTVYTKERYGQYLPGFHDIGLVA